MVSLPQPSELPYRVAQTGVAHHRRSMQRYRYDRYGILNILEAAATLGMKMNCVLPHLQWFEHHIKTVIYRG